MVGSARSGTTILDNILGEVPGVANAVEIRWSWRQGLTERMPCGCGLPPVECPRWSVGHTMAGNPNRFRTGSVRIVEDGDWKSRSARSDRMIITAAALPMLLRYGYAIHPGRRSRDAGLGPALGK
jgi:hypothetical protein